MRDGVEGESIDDTTSAGSDTGIFVGRVRCVSATGCGLANNVASTAFAYRQAGAIVGGRKALARSQQGHLAAFGTADIVGRGGMGGTGTSGTIAKIRAHVVVPTKSIHRLSGAKDRFQKGSVWTNGTDKMTTGAADPSVITRIIEAPTSSIHTHAVVATHLGRIQGQRNRYLSPH